MKWKETKKEKKQNREKNDIEKKEKKETNVCVPRQIMFLATLCIYMYVSLFPPLSLGKHPASKKDQRNNYKIQNE